MPYRFAVDRVTGAISVGDVGTDQYEEIDLIPASAAEVFNYGWPCYEGGAEGEPVRRYLDEPYCIRNYYMAADEEQLTTAPLYAYSGKGGAALVLGPHYGGGPYPDELDGKLVFADFIRDRFWTYADGQVADFGAPSNWGGPTDIEVTPQGTLAYTAFLTGKINEIIYLGGNADESSFRAGTLPWILYALGASVVALVLFYWTRTRRRSQA